MIETSSRRIDRPQLTDIGALARRGALWTAGFVIFRQVAGVFVTAIMARLLVPEDFGLMAMVATLFALIKVFSNLGLSFATIHNETLTEDQSHVLFWINTLVGFALAGFAVAAAPVVATFYGEARLTAVIAWMSLSLIVGGLAVQPSALMRRQMQFRSVVSTQAAGYVVGILVAIVLASMGAGYWALVAQSIITAAVTDVAQILISGYRPRRPRSVAGVSALLRFGGYLSISNFLVYLQTNADNIIVGRFLGSDELAFYSRAYFLMLLPSILSSQMLGSVMGPALAAYQNNPQSLGAAYRKALQMIATVSFPIGMILLLHSEEIVRIIYGDQWNSVVPILTWMSILVVVHPIYNTQSWLFMAVGKGRSYFLMMLWVTGVLLLAFRLGVQSGVVAVAGAYAISMSTLVTIPVMLLAHRASRISLIATLRTLVAPGIAMSVMAAVMSTSSLLIDLSRLMSFLVSVALGGIVYLVSILILISEYRSMTVGFLARWDFRRA